MKKKKKHIGLHAYRCKGNPEERNFEERNFAEAWAKQDEYERDYLVAATLLQWLGSEGGQGFLRDLGYEKIGADLPTPKLSKRAQARLSAMTNVGLTRRVRAVRVEINRLIDEERGLAHEQTRRRDG